MLGAVDAARLASVLWFALATSSLWYATYRLARRSEAQPVALAFGGEASPRDYGRMLADIALLLTLATFGIVVRLHETIAETALFAWVSALLLALTVALDEDWKGTVAAGLVLAAAALTRGWLSAGLLAIAAAVFLAVPWSPAGAPRAGHARDCDRRLCALAAQRASCWCRTPAST